jgi:hypothetical protein
MGCSDVNVACIAKFLALAKCERPRAEFCFALNFALHFKCRAANEKAAEGFPWAA